MTKRHRGQNALYLIIYHEADLQKSGFIPNEQVGGDGGEEKLPENS